MTKERQVLWELAIQLGMNTRQVCFIKTKGKDRIIIIENKRIQKNMYFSYGLKLILLSASQNFP